MNQLINPSSNFNRVRDGRNAPDAYIDFPLDTTFDQFVNIAGNAFYADANPFDGNCVVYFQETDNLRGPTPFYVSPGFIARIPYTQIRVVNTTAQPGKKIRLIYGVDIDFQPGSVAQVGLTGNLTLTTRVLGTASQDQLMTGSLTGIIGTNVATLFNTFANTAGLTVQSARVNTLPSAGGLSRARLIVRNALPTSIFDTIALAGNEVIAGGGYTWDELQDPVFIPAGLGIYLVGFSDTTAGALHSASVKILLP